MPQSSVIVGALIVGFLVFITMKGELGKYLETLGAGEDMVRFLWLIPITTAEAEFARANGREALEQRFDAAPLRYWDVRRTSIV